MHTIHPSYRNTRYAIADTSSLGMFRFGFERAVFCWNSGTPIESIQQTVAGDSPKARGVRAACDMLHGWLDGAEREAMAHGMSRAASARFVTEQSAIAKPHPTAS